MSDDALQLSTLHLQDVSDAGSELNVHAYTDGEREREGEGEGERTRETERERERDIEIERDTETEMYINKGP